MKKAGKRTRKGFEEKLKRLEEISVLFEKEELDLEDSVARYQEALELYRDLNSLLDQAERAIVKSEENFALKGNKDFKPAEADEEE